MDGPSRAGLKALYSDGRERAAVAAGIGAYLYTALEPVVLPIGPDDRQVQLIRRSGKPDMLARSPGTEQWLRHGYQQRSRAKSSRPSDRKPTSSASSVTRRLRNAPSIAVSSGNCSEHSWPPRVRSDTDLPS